MPLTREQKQKIKEDLKKKIDKQKSIILVDFTGLKAASFFDLRKKIKKISNELKVVKKTMLGLVFREKGLKIDIKKIKGEVALVFGMEAEDEITSAKTIYQFTQTNSNLKILGGYFKNEVRETEEIISLAKLSNREELLTKLTGSLLFPISGLVGVLQGNIKGLIYALNAIKNK